MKKAKIDGVLWLRENTIKRCPNAAPFLEWFGTKDDDESSDSPKDASSDDCQA